MGTRRLVEGPDAAAWLEGRRALAEEQLAKDKTPVAPFWVNKYKTDVAKNWDLFYKQHRQNFFKDRHWMRHEFSEVFAVDAGSARRVLLEVGCGVGNLVFPTMEEVAKRDAALSSPPPALFAYACDFSPRAIALVKANPMYDTSKCLGFVADIVKDDLTETVTELADFVTSIFVLSAIAPENMATAVANLAKVLKPGGILYFRDYGLYDHAQLRFQSGHRLSEGCYARSDGTLSFYFSIERVRELFEAAGLQVVSLEYAINQTTNTKLNVTFERVFVHAKVRKPL